MIVIGVDPGIATTGYGIVKSENENMKCLDFGVIKTDKNHSPSLRLNTLSKKLSSLIKNYSPNFLAVENIYFFKNLKSAFPVSQAKGVIMLTAERKKIPVFEFTPLEIKMNITGYGRADKKQVQEMIKITLNLQKIPRPVDAADALGAAVCGILKKRSSFLE